ncbi:MAG: hypothetical protein GXP49_00215 [Deltaproteobacteria bacterium]|nr:hypothetical protein [Deltaproteobacteria bacterium]
MSCLKLETGPSKSNLLCALLFLSSLILLNVAGCSGSKDKNPGENTCGSHDYHFESVIPGPLEHGYDAALEAKAFRFDRQFHVFHTFATGMSCDLSVPMEWTKKREAIRSFLQDTDSWDFEAETGYKVTDVVSAWHISPGAYAGAGIAADAFRYGTLRDQGYDCEEVVRARKQLLAGLDGLHIAKAITGTPGVIARAIARKDLPGDGRAETTPLFDGNGNPLPEEKNNGTWREDNSGGLYPDFVWVDSCSRDMYIGWALAFGAAFEVIHDDPEIDDSYKERLAEDARDLAEGLMVVHHRDKGDFDLEIPDADGRTTFHGYMNENNLERAYLPGVDNGFYALMALGAVSALADASGDQKIRDYLENELIGKRKLHEIARDHMITVDAGVGSNYSNYNMAFDGAWLSSRHLKVDDARKAITVTVDKQLYNRPNRERQPIEQKQTFYDFVWAIAKSGEGAGIQPVGGVDRDAVQRGLETLQEFWKPPFFDEARVNCDEEEIATRVCKGIDGTTLDIHPDLGRGGKVVSVQPVPMRIRPASNYYWRSNPYEVNGGGGGALIPGVDFRFAYWMGRWARK